MIMRELTIDKERENEFSEIYDLVKVAFQTAEHSDGDEGNRYNWGQIS